jgi:YidC/Oxa1 family membrane protein insertase
MPLIFAFIMARQPAGLVIYYCWNNLLTALQQNFIQRRAGKDVDSGSNSASVPARSKG